MAIQPASSSIPVVPLVNIRPPVEAHNANASDKSQASSVDKAAVAQQPAATANTTNNPNSKQTSTQQQVQDAAEKANKAIEALKSNLQFTVDKSTGINVVKIVDTETKQTIRQIPSEEMLSIAHRLEEIKGLLIKNSA